MAAGPTTSTAKVGNDELEGGGGTDHMYGGTGSDTYFVDHINDRIYEQGGEGFDVVFTNADYWLTAGADIEELRISDSAAWLAIDLSGNNSGNAIFGNNADNMIAGGYGNDHLTGGLGDDGFLFNSLPGPGNVDEIHDFAPGRDLIYLSETVFVAPEWQMSAAQTISIDHLAFGAAQDADDYLIYDETTGALFFDADGSGQASDPVQFASLDPFLSLLYEDFMLTA